MGLIQEHSDFHMFTYRQVHPHTRTPYTPKKSVAFWFYATVPRSQDPSEAVGCV